VNGATDSGRVAVIVAIRVRDGEREPLIGPLLEAVRQETRAPDDILIVDEADADATRALAREAGARLVPLPTGEGPAGAFYAGMKEAYDDGFDWLWLLYDDVLPEPSALERLLQASTAVPDLPAPYLLASKVLTPAGQLHPGHAPFADTKRVPHAVRSVSSGLVPVRSADFASLLVSRAAIRDHGLPIGDYFDGEYDREYTARLLREGIGFVVPASVVRRDAQPGRRSSGQADGLYLDVRNAVFMMKGDAWMGREKVQLAIDLVPRARAGLRDSGLRGAGAVARGLADGLRRSA